MGKESRGFAEPVKREPKEKAVQKASSIERKSSFKSEIDEKRVHLNKSREEKKTQRLLIIRLLSVTCAHLHGVAKRNHKQRADIATPRPSSTPVLLLKRE